MYEDNKYILKFSVETNNLVSTNEAYFHMPKRSKKSNRLTTYTVKTDKLKKLQEEMHVKLQSDIPTDYVKLISELVDLKFFGLKIVSIYFMPSNNYKDSDVSNYIKNYEDCIATRLKEFSKNLDDKNNIEYRAIKRYKEKDEEDSNWTIITIIYPIEKDMKYRCNNFKLYCPICNDYVETLYDSHSKEIYHEVSLNKFQKERHHLKLYLNNKKALYGVTTVPEMNRCTVCGSILKDNKCDYCGIERSDYEELINYFNEEELNYEI